MKVEAYDKGAIYSYHSSAPLGISLKKTFFLLFPRAFTPVCSAEVDELSEKFQELVDLGWDVYAGSTDSPEVMQHWRPEAKIPLITIPKTSDFLREFLDSETSYANRVAVWIVDGEVVNTYQVPNSDKRVWEEIVLESALN